MRLTEQRLEDFLLPDDQTIEELELFLDDEVECPELAKHDDPEDIPDEDEDWVESVINHSYIQ